MPPVTAEKSPPDSRITGADSPVMADSSTEATPSITSPSAGMRSPASTSTTSPFRSRPPSTLDQEAPGRGSWRRFAITARRARRSEAAWALARPSATLSAKLANKSVNQSHRVTARMNPAGASPWPPSAWTYRAVVRRLPRYTTNITGLRHWYWGASFLNESPIAWRKIVGSKSEAHTVLGSG